MGKKFELSEGPDFVYTEVTITKPTHDYRKSHSRMTFWNDTHVSFYFEASSFCSQKVIFTGNFCQFINKTSLHCSNCVPVWEILFLRSHCVGRVAIDPAHARDRMDCTVRGWRDFLMSARRTSMLWFEALIGQPAQGWPGERAERQTIRWTFESRRVQSTQKISTVFVAAAHRHQLHRRRTGYNGAFGLTPASLFCGHGWFTSLVNRLVACLQVFQSEKTDGACQKWLIT